LEPGTIGIVAVHDVVPVAVPDLPVFVDHVMLLMPAPSVAFPEKTTVDADV
jgi:hypothetical protein